MYKYSYILMIALLFLFSIFWSFMNGRPDLLDLYGGVPYFGNWYVILLNYFLFSCYSFVVFNKSDKYISGYGIYVVLRVQSKMKMITQVIYQTFIFVVVCEFMKVVIYIFTLLIVYRHFYLENVFIFINMFFIHTLFLFIFLLLQIILELFVDSKLALTFVQITYLLLIPMSDFMNKIIGENYLNLLFLPNILMYKRLESFYTFDLLHICLLYILFLLSFFLLVLITKKCVHKKNWL